MAMNGEVLEYKEVFQENRGAMHGGRLQLLNEKLIFKNSKTGKVDTILKDDLTSAVWRRVARDYELKVCLSNGQVFKFDGFKEQELERVQNFLDKKYGINIQQQELSAKGWNWGKTDFEGSEMRFEVGSKTSFEIPLSNVSQCALTRDEVTLEFHQNDDSELSLMEMRFYIPPSQDDDVDRVKEFHDNVMAKADVLQIKGNAICTFQDMHCLTPRGRYDIRMYPKFIQLHGKTFDYKITYTSVLRLFLLPHKDQRQIFFVVSLDPPLKQGQTRYHFLILLFFKEDDLSVEFSLSEEEMQERFNGHLEKEMSGPMYEIVSRVMKHLVQRKITVPGSFKGQNSTQSITCAYKASSGFLFPLERGFMYVHKPPIHVRFDEIAYVNFARGKANINRFFDFEIETRSKTTYIFSNIERDQYSALYDFVSNKKLKIKNIGKDGVNYHDTMEGSDEEEAGVVHDPYLARMKQEAADRDEQFGGDDDDESEDEDFNPEEQGPEVAEEFDSDPESSDEEGEEEEEGSDEMSEEEKPKPKKAKKEKKQKREKPVKEGRSRKRKQQKDPNAPKRPSSAYMLWLNDSRSRMKDENPGISITELSKLAGKEWKTISSSVKEKYEKRYLDLKEKYQDAMSDYKKSGGGGSFSKSPAPAKKARAPVSKPKSGVSSTSPSKFKSKEFITESDSMSSDSDAEGKSVKSKSKAKSGSESEEEEAEMTPGESSEAEESESGSD